MHAVLRRQFLHTPWAVLRQQLLHKPSAAALREHLLLTRVRHVVREMVQPYVIRFQKHTDCVEDIVQQCGRQFVPNMQ